MVQKEDLPHQKAAKAFEALARYHVPYVIVGGAALALHGIPRSTLDVDIVVPARSEAIAKVFKAAEYIGLKSQQARILTLASKPNLLIGQWITFEDREKRHLIDVFLESEEQFKKLFRKSVKRRSGKTTFRIASLDDLEKMKKAASRRIDLADVALIQELRKIQKSKRKIEL